MDPQEETWEEIQSITCIPYLVTVEKNFILLREIAFKMKETVMEMTVGKSLMPIVFTTNFFQECWLVMEKYVWELVEDSSSQLNIPHSYPQRRRKLNK